MRTRVFRANLVASLLLASCGVAGDPTPTADSPRVLLQLDGEGELPAATLLLGDERHEGVLGTHCWEFSGGGFCADAPALPEPSSSVEIEEGTILTVQGDFETLQATLGTPETVSFEMVGARGFVELRHPVELDLFDEEERLTAEPGRYVLEVFATWPEGDGVFSFGITITDDQR